MAISLFPHNELAYEKLVDKLRDNQRVTINHATGTGKSFIALKYMYENKDKKILYLTPTYPIYNQLIGPHMKDLGIDYKDFSCLDNIIYQNLLKMDMKELAQKYDIIIFDEYHRCGAKEWNKKIKELFSIVENEYPEKRLIGLTATPTRYLDHERNMTDELFGGVCASELLLSDAIINGLLPTPQYVNLPINSLDEIQRLKNLINKELPYQEDRDYYSSRLSEIEDKLTSEISLLNEANIHLEKDEGKFVVFCSKINDIEKNKRLIEKQFQGKELNFYEVHSKQTKEKNDLELDSFRNTKKGYNFIFVVDILNEGVHVKDVDGVFMLRKTTSPIIYFQQLGRLLSYSARDKNLVLWDLVDNLKNHEVVYKLYNEVISRAKELLVLDPANKERYERILENFKIIDRSTELLSGVAALNEELSHKKLTEIRVKRVVKILTTLNYPDRFQYLQAKKDLEYYYVYLTKEDFIKLKNSNVPLPSQINVSVDVFESMLNGYRNLYEFNTNVANHLYNELQNFITNYNCLPNLNSLDEEERNIALDIQKYYPSFNDAFKAKIKKLLKAFPNQEILPGLDQESEHFTKKIDSELIMSLIMQGKIKPFKYLKLTNFKNTISSLNNQIKRKINYTFQKNIYLDKLKEIRRSSSVGHVFFNYLDGLDTKDVNVLLVNDIASLDLNEFGSSGVVRISSSMKLSDIQEVLTRNKKVKLFIIDDLDLLPLLSDQIDNLFVLKNSDSNFWLNQLVQLNNDNFNVLNTHVIDLLEKKASYNSFKNAIIKLKEKLTSEPDEDIETLFKIIKDINGFSYVDLSIENEMELQRLSDSIKDPETVKSKLDTAIYVINSSKTEDDLDFIYAKNTIIKYAKYITLEQYDDLKNHLDCLPAWFPISREDFIKELGKYSCLQEKEDSEVLIIINAIGDFIEREQRVPTILSKDRDEVKLAVDFLNLPSNKAKKDLLERIDLLPRLTVFERALYGLKLSNQQKIYLIQKLESVSDKFLLNPFVQRIIRRIQTGNDLEVVTAGEVLFRRFRELNQAKQQSEITYEETAQAFEQLKELALKYHRISKGDSKMASILYKYEKAFEKYGFSKEIADMTASFKKEANRKILDEIIEYIERHHLMDLPSDQSPVNDEVTIARKLKRIQNDLTEEQQAQIASYQVDQKALNHLANLYYSFVLEHKRRPQLLTTDEEEYQIAFNYMRLSKKIRPDLIKRNQLLVKDLESKMLEREFAVKNEEISKCQDIIINYLLNKLVLFDYLNSKDEEDARIIDLYNRFKTYLTDEQKRRIRATELTIKNNIWKMMMNYLKNQGKIPSSYSEDEEERTLANKYEMIEHLLTYEQKLDLDNVRKKIFITMLIDFIKTHNGDYPALKTSDMQEAFLAKLMQRYFYLLTSEERYLIQITKNTIILETQDNFWPRLWSFIKSYKRIPSVDSEDEEERYLAIRYNRNESFMTREQKDYLQELISEFNIDNNLHTP